LTESAQGSIEAVAMPVSLHQVIASFITEYHVERTFQKRERDRANPEALARHDPPYRGQR
jgi:hypothetical protein